MVDKSTFLPMRTVGDGNEGQAQAFMVLNLRQRNLQVNFSLPIYSNQKFANPADIYHQYRVKIPFPQLGRIFETWDHNSGCLSHLTILEDPPCYHRRVKNIASTFIDHNSWKEADTWFRQTSIVHNPYGLASSPVSLRRIRPIIDIGERLHTLPPYLLTFTARPLECF